MPIDYTGSHGGLLAMAFAAGVMFTATVMMAVGGFIWRIFFEPRIAELKASLADERAECDVKIKSLEQQVDRLQTLLLLHGPAALRAQLQPVLSEIHTDLDKIKGDGL